MSMDSQNIMAFQNAGQSQPSMFKGPAHGGMNAAQALGIKSTSSKRAASAKMNAAPRISGATVMMAGADDDHMDKAMVAKMGINGFGRIGRLVFRSTFMGQKD